MSRLVRIMEGDWVKSEIGEWAFISDQNFFGFGAIVRDGECFESLEAIVRSRYMLDDGTPAVLTYNIQSRCLCDMEGQHPHYCYQYRTDFTVGRTAYEGGGGQDVRPHTPCENITGGRFS
ncbi:hypothetical protein DY000_02016891 [Brassica cretica]|uniref:Uncharacterized protein n=1 Tax=Brassica cretica TaxID=69181 RepID=A0ABQ7D9I2_BRACR|nr:hypothetical protein DY000_02016891 [Brassica cretica]